MFIHQTNGVTDGCCFRAPEPNDGAWFEVADDDPRCKVAMPPAPTMADQILNDPVELAKLKKALGL